MKRFSIVGISSNNRLIGSTDNFKTYQQMKIEGFDINSNPQYRIFFDQLINKDIQCSFSKNQQNLRYHNQPILVKLLENNALKINQTQLQQSKIFNNKQKQKFYNIAGREEKDNRNLSIFLNHNNKQNQKVLKQFIRSQQQLQVRIECFSQYLLLSFNKQNKKHYLRCKLTGFKQYFNLFPEATLYKTLDSQQNKKLFPRIGSQFRIKIGSIKHNLLQKTKDIKIQILNKQILHRMLQNGWIDIDSNKIFNFTIQEYKQKIQLIKKSMKQSKGIHLNQSDLLNYIYKKSNFVGVVTNIIQGYIYEVSTVKNMQKQKIQLPIVTCPIGEDLGSYQCRQFARKQLIGKQVNVYLQKQGGLNTTGNIIRIEDSKDIQSILLESGMAYIKQEYKNSLISQKYTHLESKAKQKKKGIHRNQLGNKRYEDLTQITSNKINLKHHIQRRLEILSKLNTNQSGVIEQILSPSRYKIRIESLNVIIICQLSDVIEPFLNPNLKQYSQFHEQSRKFLNFNFNQRNIIANIQDYDSKTNTYYGCLSFQKPNKIDIQEILISASILYSGKSNQRYVQLENIAKKSNKLIWQDKLKSFEPLIQLEQQNYCFQGRFSWIKNGKIVYVQPKNNFTIIQNLQNQIRQMKLSPVSKNKQSIGVWCVATYCNQLYRALIKAKKGNTVTVSFIDWGNEQIVNSDSIYELPQKYCYLKRQCIEVSLNLIAPTKNIQCLQRVREYLFEGIYVFKKVRGNSIDVFESQNSTINVQLIMKSLLKADSQQLNYSQQKQLLKDIQEQLRKQRIGIWEDSDSSSEQELQIQSPYKE